MPHVGSQLKLSSVADTVIALRVQQAFWTTSGTHIVKYRINMPRATTDHLLREVFGTSGRVGQSSWSQPSSLRDQTISVVSVVRFCSFSAKMDRKVARSWEILMYCGGRAIQEISTLKRPSKDFLWRREASAIVKCRK